MVKRTRKMKRPQYAIADAIAAPKTPRPAPTINPYAILRRKEEEKEKAQEEGKRGERERRTGI